MAGARKDLTTNLAPADEPLGAEYEHDFYSWLMEQARHLRLTAEYELMVRLGLTHRAFYNSGVMLFKRSADTAVLFESWHQEWKRFGKTDQMALVRAAALTGTTVRTLPVIWNSPAREFASVREAQAAGVRILRLPSSDGESPAGANGSRGRPLARGSPATVINTSTGAR